MLPCYFFGPTFGPITRTCTYFAVFVHPPVLSKLLNYHFGADSIPITHPKFSISYKLMRSNGGPLTHEAPFFTTSA